MGRPRQFDPDAALQGAMDLFWDQGYESTSVEQLVERTGLSRSSLYDTFGDKRALFMRALERYDEIALEQLVGCLRDAESPLGGVKQVFGMVLECCEKPEGSRGCMLANTLAEFGRDDIEIQERIEKNLERIEDAFCEALGRALAVGELHEGRRPRALARFLVNNLLGLKLVGRGRPDKHVARDVVETVLRAVDCC